jgi:hypothetical protein
MPYRYVHRYKDRHGRVRYYFRATANRLRFRSNPERSSSNSPTMLYYCKSRWRVSVGCTHGSTWHVAMALFAVLQLTRLSRTRCRNTTRSAPDTGLTCQEPLATRWQPGIDPHLWRCAVACHDATGNSTGSCKRTAEGHQSRLRLGDASGVQNRRVTNNPAKSVRHPKENPDAGYHTWTLEEGEQFENRHLIGTRAMLALALFLFTDQRRSDVVLFGRQQVCLGVWKAVLSEGFRQQDA